MFFGTAFTLSLLTIPVFAAADPDLLLKYTFDGGPGKIVRDLSGNGLDGTVTAQWTDSPSGKALLFDGKPGSIVTVTLPPPLRFGRRSWSFTAWIKPVHLSIKDRQNQRRLFAFGKYPDAYLVIDLTGNGTLTCYFCYKNAGGTIVSTGASSALHVKAGEWAFIAIVCDRDARKIWPYVNGYCRAPNSIRSDFDGDYTLGGELTLGNGWHNYWGVMDEVRVVRRALRPNDIQREFQTHRKTFGVVESAEAIRVRKQDQIMKAFADVNGAWAKGDLDTVQKLCSKIIAAPDAPSALRSIAHLRLAQSYLAQGDAAAGRAMYASIRDQSDYPAVHRAEAEECIREIDRTRRGQPARDPMASRTSVPVVKPVAAEIVIAPDGNDEGDGSAAHPFATLHRARDAVRALKAKGVTGAIQVTLRPGEYEMTETLALEKQDSGAPGAPVVYRAAEKGTVRLYGGRRLTGFTPVTDPAVLERLPAEARGKVLLCDLKSRGITDYGKLRDRGFGLPHPPPTLELYFNGKSMTLARWPNTGFVGIEKLVDPGSKAKGRPSIIKYKSDRPSRWTAADDIYLFGYFRYLWADAAIKVASIDTAARTLTTAKPYPYGGGMSTGQGIQYYAFNLLEEIDRPGEWYLDRKTGILYFYPPAAMDNATVEIGMLSKPMLTLNNVADVRIEGLVFDLGRYDGIHINDSERCLVLGCTVSRMAGNGITIHGGHEDGIIGCDIHTIGRRATEVIGGDRKTLTPGKHVVENCRIHFFGRIDRTYTPAIQLEGVGNRVAHNLMYNAPSSVMRIEGNDHLIEFNDVHDAVLESDDQGSMELFRNATYRGVVFRYNRFRNIGKPGPGRMVHGQAAIRLDDAISGICIYGNIFIHGASGHFGAVQMNSGRDNVIDNNLFIDCKQGVSGGWHAGNSVWRMLREGRKPAGFYTGDLYLSRYPEIATMLDDPGINHLWRNVFSRCGPMITGNPAFLDRIGNVAFDDSDPGFTDASAGDYRFAPNAKVFAEIAFHPIPINEIGLYPDTYRATWPPVAANPSRR